MPDFRHSIHIILYQPEIPPNTGNLIRLCANTGCQLHLIEPLGFSMDAKSVRRAGLDYHEAADVKVHENLSLCLDYISKPGSGVPRGRIFAATTKGSIPYDEIAYELGDILIFGPETRGLPDSVLEDKRVSHRIRIPMLPESRSLNLSNSVAIMTYEALRQLRHPNLY